MVLPLYGPHVGRAFFDEVAGDLPEWRLPDRTATRSYLSIRNLLCIPHGAPAVRTMQQRPARLTRMAIDEIRRLAPHAPAAVGMPAHHAVLRNIAPQHAAVLLHPDRPLAPDAACGQDFK